MKLKLLFALVLFCILTPSIKAQEYTTAGAIAISTTEEAIPVGSIISSSRGSYVTSTTAYDPQMFAVTTDAPSTYIDDLAIENKHLVVTSGETRLRVSTQNGTIQEGDFLTSSQIPGVAQRATQTGTIVGIALEDYDGSEEGYVMAFIDIGTQYISTDLQTTLLNSLRNAFQAPFLTPVLSLRYLVAAALLTTAFIIGFLNFRRISGSSIEALGRNPLAQKAIRTTVVLNFAITFSIMLGGVVLAIGILIL